MTNLEVLKKQLEYEVIYVENLIKTNPTWATPAEIGWNAIERCLGMVTICQLLPEPVSFKDVEPLFEKAKYTIMEMMEGEVK